MIIFLLSKIKIILNYSLINFYKIINNNYIIIIIK